jgi:tripartite-type tricarboxylate transporter receptor subunit TctC
MIHLQRRQWLRLCAAGAVSSAVGLHAQPAAGFPERAIKLVVPYGPAGGPDVLARLLGQQLTTALGQPVVVENRPGGNGVVAAQQVARSANDGYTLLVADTGHMAINPALYPNLPYDPERDFVPISLAAQTPFFLVANSAKVSATNLRELVALAQAKPGTLNYGSSGNGSPHHLATEIMKAELRIDMVHVPFKGVAASVPALLGGEIDLMFVALPSVAAAVESGKLRVLGVSTPQRTPFMPAVPTIAEQGVPGFDMGSRMGLLAPAGTPADRVARLEKAVVQLLRAPELSSRFAGIGMEAVASSGAAYAQQLRSDRVRYQQLVQRVGLKVD